MNTYTYPNPFKQKLQSGQLVLGTNLDAAVPTIATQACQSGIDFLWIDTEHGPYGVESLGAIPALVRQLGVAPMIRVAWNDPALIKKAYDVGAVAVMVPQVSTAEEAARAVQYARYPPIGQRGISPNWPQLVGEDWGNVVRTANEETVLIVQIESAEAYANLDAIARVPGIDVLFTGPMDLSASLGITTDMQNPKLQAIMQDVPKRLMNTGLVTGTTLTDVSELQQKIGWGYRFLNVGSPMGYGVSALRQHVQALRSTPMPK